MRSNAFLSMTAPMKFVKSATSPTLMSLIIASSRPFTSFQSDLGT